MPTRSAFPCSCAASSISRRTRRPCRALREEGSRPFSYTQTRSGKVVTVNSFWRLPERLYDDPEELAEWTRAAVAVAQRQKLAKRARAKKPARKQPQAKQARRSGRRRKRASRSTPSGNQATCVRGGGADLRIGLAHHPVAAVPLGGIEAFVAALDQRLRVVVLLQGGDADRDGDAAEMLAGRALHQLLGHHRAADVVGHRDGGAQDRVGQDDGEFLAAVARGGVLALDVLLDRASPPAAAPGRRSDGRSCR